MNRTLKIISINLAVLLILLLILEIVLRVLNIGYGNMPVENNRVLHHVHPANYTFLSYVSTKEYGGHNIKFDSNRYRVNENGTKKTTGKTIWFLGDSFTEAAQVSWGNSFIGRTEALLKDEYSVINFGVTSYSPLLYFIQLKKNLTLHKKPSMVFIQLYGNDISSDDQYAKVAKFDEKDEPVYCDGGSTTMLKQLIRKLYIVRTFKRIQLTLQYEIDKHKYPEKMDELRFANYVEHAPVIDTGYRFTKSVLQIHSLLEAENIPHYFFAIPSKYSAIVGKWNVNSFSEQFIKFAQEKQLPVINLEEAFKEASKSHKLFYEVDVHCNEKGHELIAQGIYKVLKTVNTNQITKH